LVHELVVILSNGRAKFHEEAFLPSCCFVSFVDISYLKWELWL
jgi:hypothetical protein